MRQSLVLPDLTIPSASIDELIGVAKKGNVEAQCELGCGYYNGLRTDKKAAEKWFMKADNKGNTKARYRLGYLYDHQSIAKEAKFSDSEKTRYVTVMGWLSKSAEQRYADAQCDVPL